MSYGALVTVTLHTLETRFVGLIAIPPTTAEAVGFTLAWSATLGLVIAAVGPLLRWPGTGRLRRLDVLGFHLGYGLLLGSWVRLTWLT